MKVNVPLKKEAERKLQVGDVIESGGHAYLVISIQGRYTAKNFSGFSGLLGIWNSLEELTEEFNRRYGAGGATIYKQVEYELQLVKKA